MDEYYEKLARQQASRDEAQAAIERADAALAASRQRPETVWTAPEPSPPVHRTVRPREPTPAPIDSGAWQRWAEAIVQAAISRNNVELAEGIGEALAAHTGERAAELRAEFAAELAKVKAAMVKQFRKELKAAEQARAEVSPTPPAIRRIS
jgi:hypothetical protein